MRRPSSMLIAGSLVLAACGSSGGTVDSGAPAAAPVTLPRDTTSAPTVTEDAPVGPTTSASPPTTAEPESAAAPNLFPDVEVIEIATGEPVNLRSLGAIDRPVLLWFWAPH